MKLIVGLGNPGSEYQKTRHNIGFMVIDALAAALEVSFQPTKQAKAEIAELPGFPEKVIIMKPQTFMNNSGEAVAAYARYNKIEPKDIWVLSDDLDLPFGQIRIRDTGSSGGHNGLQSVIDALKTADFYRFRLGIGRPGQSTAEITEPAATVYVLQPFDHKQLLEPVIKEVTTVLVDNLKAGQVTCHTWRVAGLPDDSAD